MVSATTEQIANSPNISRKTPIPLPAEFGGTGSTQSATGTGSVVLSNNPVLVTPNLGTPSTVILTHGTGLVPSSGLAASGIPSSSTFLRGDNSWISVTGAPGGSNTQLQYNNSGVFAGITGATSDGIKVTLIAPILGTPTSGTLTTCSGLIPSSGLAASGTPSSSTFLRGDNSWATSTLPSVPTRQVLTSGSSATYTTPANVRQLRIRMVGGGGGGSGSGSGTGDGGNGVSSSFNSITAGAGNGGLASADGGTSTTGSGSASLRVPGQRGIAGGNVNGWGAPGGSTVLGMGGIPPYNGAGVIGGNYGGGGSSASGGQGGPVTGGAGGGGEYLELIINSPSATYVYTVGTGGAAGTAGSGGRVGGAGSPGIIIVDEIY